MPFYEVLSKIAYVLFIIGSVLFGISLAVNLLIVSTVRKMTKSSSERFNDIPDAQKKEECLKVIKNAEHDFAKCVNEATLIRNVKRKNVVRKFFKLSQKQIPKSTCSVKEVFLNLIKDVANPMVDGSGRGYTSFSERDVFRIVRSVKNRLYEIISSSNIPLIKTLKISFLLKCLDVYKVYSNFKENPLITVGFYLINFFAWFARVFNPVSMSKILINNAKGSTLTSILAKTTIEIVGKELAVIYYEKTLALTKTAE